MEIKQGDNRFYVGENEGQMLAEIHFVPSGKELLIIDHTEVSDELRGQNIGEKLVRIVVDYAREKGKKIVPLCPFAKGQIERHSELQDVLASHQ